MDQDSLPTTGPSAFPVGQKPETERQWPGFGCAFSNSNGNDGVGCWVKVGKVMVVVGQFVGTRKMGEGVGRKIK